MSLNGQWIGTYDGPIPGKLIADVDDTGNLYVITAALNPEDRHLPATTASLFIPKQPQHFTLDDVKIYPVDPATGDADHSDVIGKQFPNVVFPTSAKVSGTWTDEELSLTWTTNQGVTGTATLPKTRSGHPSDYKAKSLSWDDFKATIGGLEGRRYLFRGQSKPWRLRTTFHRTGRANLIRFRFEDVPTLHRHLSGLTKHVFNFSIPDEFGAFLNLVQHHGYPTPLLDWTYSPYVAAFFAYREITRKQISEAQDNDKIRIVLFDQRVWRETFNQRLVLSGSREHFSLLDPLAIENQRMIPQQAAVSVTNVDDIEKYIRDCEATTEKSFLSMFDLPVSSRDPVMSELSYMGITAGSMFPGIDGACEELRERNFRV